MKHIIHDRNAKYSVTIFKNCNQGITGNSKLLETLIPYDNQPQQWLDLAVFLMTSDCQHTETGYESFYLR
ncbi:MAG: hypothetical protein F6J89_09210 [Symploca sp. SIO1C4]|uniref:Uncharacterized protein n=1 Tax=Symploca sp. SIO1C4 TaxID=2607765 RepID=A0A6B3NA81_9CYAN|nr:hypothetical protein [Symploca sp. SIO1C4]